MIWSTKLFLMLNKQVGKRRWVDLLWLYFAHYLIYLVFFLILTWAITVLYIRDPLVMILYIKQVMTGVIFGLLVSYLSAVFIKRPRPVVTIPEIKQLFRPAETWKSFPSDHTLVSFVCVGLTFIFGAPFWFVTMLVVLSLLVGLSRVWSGVHYPVDIIGGIVYGLAVAYFCDILLKYISQPLYSYFFKLFV